MKILIFGVTGMLGSCVYKYFSNLKEFQVTGVLRNISKKSFFNENRNSRIVKFENYNEYSKLEDFIKNIKPDYVINCLGVIKQKINKTKPETTLFINSYLPHLIDQLSSKHNFKLIHFSTDCVFDGNDGLYKENDIPLPQDFYGISKLLGELKTKNTLTIRTSIIGHELESTYSLVNWFLSSKNSVKGFTNAIYSGFPSVELARIIHKFIIPNKSISGIYNLSSNPISKYELLKIISKQYKHEIDIVKDNKIVIDRSLDATRFNMRTKYVCPSWPKLIEDMYEFQGKYGYCK